MLDKIERILQDFARFSFNQGLVDENTSIHLVEDAQNYIEKNQYYLKGILSEDVAIKHLEELK